MQIIDNQELKRTQDFASITKSISLEYRISNKEFWILKFICFSSLFQCFLLKLKLVHLFHQAKVGVLLLVKFSAVQHSLLFVYCDLFVIWGLSFVISPCLFVNKSTIIRLKILWYDRHKKSNRFRKLSVVKNICL